MVLLVLQVVATARYSSQGGSGETLAVVNGFSVASASDPGDTHGAYYSIIVDRVYGL